MVSPHFQTQLSKVVELPTVEIFTKFREDPINRQPLGGLKDAVILHAAKDCLLNEKIRNAQTINFKKFWAFFKGLFIW